MFSDAELDGPKCTHFILSVKVCHPGGNFWELCSMVPALAMFWDWPAARKSNALLPVTGGFPYLLRISLEYFLIRSFIFFSKS
jgi:hypothetical protein